MSISSHDHSAMRFLAFFRTHFLAIAPAPVVAFTDNVSTAHLYLFGVSVFFTTAIRDWKLISVLRNKFEAVHLIVAVLGETVTLSLNCSELLRGDGIVPLDAPDECSVHFVRH